MKWRCPEDFKYCKKCDGRFTSEHECFQKPVKKRKGRKVNAGTGTSISYNEVMKHGTNPLLKYVEKE